MRTVLYDGIPEKLAHKKDSSQSAADINGIQTATTYSRECIDFKQILEHQARKDEDAGFVAEWNGRVVGYMLRYILFPALKAAMTTISPV